MTLVFSGIGKIIQGQFGVNEIASAITIGRWVGSVLTRSSDARIFDPIAAKYGLRLRALPPWLRSVTFARSGTILGERQREIHAQNTIPDVSMDSIEGVATFLVLILRFVEQVEDIVEYIEELLRGDFDIVSGGDLQTTDQVTGHPQSTLPFSLRSILRTFINAVIDADATSQQSSHCRQWMSCLVNVIGSSRFLDSSTRYPNQYHRQFLKQLLRKGTPEEAQVPFHTFAAGSAMIALAALANGANVQVECITETGKVVLPPEAARITRQRPFLVTLWLTDPPTGLAQELKMGVMDWNTRHDTTKSGAPRMLPVYGGAVEVCQVVAQQLCCGANPDEALAMWTRGVEVGQSASWFCEQPTNDGPTGEFKLFLTDEFLRTETVAQIAPLADNYFTTPRGSQLHKLARKAATIFHDVYGYSDYSFIQRPLFVSSMHLILTSLAVGCIKSLTNIPHNRLSSYAWVVDCTDTRPTSILPNFCEQLVTSGVLYYKLLWAAACIWGGSDQHNYEYSRMSSRVMGIVCPQVTILLNILVDPKAVAVYKLSKGLMTLYEGSVPLLPRDPTSGYVLAGAVSPWGLPSNISSNWQPRNPVANLESTRLILTLEPFSINGAPSVVLCVWYGGHVALQLDLKRVYCNIMVDRNYTASKDQGENTSTTPPSTPPGAMPRAPDAPSRSYEIPCLDLLEIGQYNLLAGAAIIRTGTSAEWQIVAAGCAPDYSVVWAWEDGDIPDVSSWSCSASTYPTLILRTRPRGGAIPTSANEA
jgi:hypothetical protein